MLEDFKTILEKNNFEKRLKKLEKNFQNKKIIIYGAGSFFKYIIENYDLSKLNIIGISDMKFSLTQQGEKYLGYPIIPLSKINEHNPDIVLLAIQNYMDILEDFITNVFPKTQTKVYPLVKSSIGEMLVKIWS